MAATNTLRGFYKVLPLDTPLPLLIPQEAVANALSGCYQYLKRLLLMPLKVAATNTLSGFYKALPLDSPLPLLIPSEAATNTLIP